VAGRDMFSGGPFEQVHENVNFWGQEVKGQGHIVPK